MCHPPLAPHWPAQPSISSPSCLAHGHRGPPLDVWVGGCPKGIESDKQNRDQSPLSRLGRYVSMQFQQNLWSLIQCCCYYCFLQNLNFISPGSMHSLVNNQIILHLRDDRKGVGAWWGCLHGPRDCVAGPQCVQMGESGCEAGIRK